MLRMFSIPLSLLLGLCLFIGCRGNSDDQGIIPLDVKQIRAADGYTFELLEFGNWEQIRVIIPSDLMIKQRNSEYKPIVLPPKPETDSELEVAYWQCIRASHEECKWRTLKNNSLRDKVLAEAALETFTQEWKLAKDYWEFCTKDVENTGTILKELIAEGNVEENLKILSKFSKKLPPGQAPTLEHLLDARYQKKLAEIK